MIRLDPDLCMTPEQAEMWDATNALYAERIPEIERKMKAMRLPELKVYAKSVYAPTRGCSVRADYERAIRSILMSDCAGRTGFTTSRGYGPARPINF